MRLIPISILLTCMCNQEVYDLLYKGLILKAMESGLRQSDIDAKNSGIEILRKLCNGQLSSWEKGEKTKQ